MNLNLMFNKYETPKAKLIALSDKSIKLIDVSYRHGIIRNNFGDVDKDITSNDLCSKRRCTWLSISSL
ncbi:hypothetical protein HYE18_02475 [Mycoplasmopsis bovis]|nr:hypothetical protein HYE18_02475 [Mycoplasmopsis bovis]